MHGQKKWLQERHVGKLFTRSPEYQEPNKNYEAKNDEFKKEMVVIIQT